MADHPFRAPVGGVGLDGSGARLVDESGVPVARRFSGGARPGTAVRDGSTLEWSVSPGEWTVAGGDVSAEDVDLTHVRAVFRLTGPGAADLLAKVCWLDLADDMFPDGAAARTSIVGVATELVRDDEDGPSYLLLPSRSFGEYLWGALVDAGGGQ